MKKYITMFSAAAALAVVFVAAAIFANGKFAKVSAKVAGKKAVGVELPQAIFQSETGERFDLNKALVGTERTWIVPVYYQCPGACTMVIERVLERISESEQLKSALGKNFQVVFFSFVADESFELAEKKRRFAFERKAISDATHQNAIRFLSGGGSSAEMMTRALRFQYAWDENGKFYNHDFKIFEVNSKGAVTGEYALDEINSITVAEIK